MPCAVLPTLVGGARGEKERKKGRKGEERGGRGGEGSGIELLTLGAHPLSPLRAAGWGQRGKGEKKVVRKKREKKKKEFSASYQSRHQSSFLDFSFGGKRRGKGGKSVAPAFWKSTVGIHTPGERKKKKEGGEKGYIRYTGKMWVLFAAPLGGKRKKEEKGEKRGTGAPDLSLSPPKEEKMKGKGGKRGRRMPVRPPSYGYARS